MKSRAKTMYNCKDNFSFFMLDYPPDYFNST